jgi:APA family basic amino acid/polyamine antiporter
LSEPGRHPSPGEPALLRVVGFWSLSAAIVNLTIAGSIFALPGTLANSMGPAAPLAYVLGALLFVPIVVCFAAAGSRVTATGGPYSYVNAAFGRFPAFATAAILWISSVAGSGSLSAALIDQLSQLFPWLAQPAPRMLFLVAVYGALGALNSRGIRIGAAAVTTIAAAKVLPLLILTVAGSRYVHLENLHMHAVPSWASIGSSLVLVVFAYSGIETALAPSGEVRDPIKVVPRAAFAGVAVVFALYIGVQLVAQGMLGAELARNDAPMVAVCEVIFPGGGGLVVIIATLSLLGCLHGDLLGSSRLIYALARDRLLPAALSAVSKGTQVPTRAIFAHALVACLLASAGSFKTLALLSGGAFCFVYIGVCAAAWRLQRMQVGSSSAIFHLRGSPLIPLLGIAGLLAILASLRTSEWLAIGCAALGVSAVYAVRRWPRR